jgi:hypothetical protein
MGRGLHPVALLRAPWASISTIPVVSAITIAAIASVTAASAVTAIPALATFLSLALPLFATIAALTFFAATAHLAKRRLTAELHAILFVDGDDFDHHRVAHAANFADARHIVVGQLADVA